MATFNLKKKNNSVKDAKHSKQIWGIILLALSSVVFLFSATAIWPALQKFLLGIFGVFVYPLCVLLMIVSIALMNNKKYVMSVRYALTLCLSVVFLLCIIQLIIVGGKGSLNFWEYWTLSYSKTYTAGGFLIGLLTTCIAYPLGLVGGYIIFILAEIISVALFVECYLSYIKNAQANSNQVKIQIKEKTVKRENMLDVSKKANEKKREKEEVNVVLGGSVKEELAREQSAREKLGLAGKESQYGFNMPNQNNIYRREEPKKESGVPEGVSVKEYLLSPPKIDMEGFLEKSKREEQKRLANMQNKQVAREEPKVIEENFNEMKNNEFIRPQQKVFEEQYDFSQTSQQNIKRGKLPEIKPEELVSEADLIIRDAAMEELNERRADEDFIIPSQEEEPADEEYFDTSALEEPQEEELPSREQVLNRENQRDNILNRENSRDNILNSRDNILSSRDSILERSNDRDNILNQENSRDNILNDRSRRFDLASARPSAEDTLNEMKAKEPKQEKFKPYVYNRPSLDLITTKSDDLSLLNDEVPAKRVALENALENFGIPAKVQSVVIGPTVTRYEIAMPEGISVKRILSLDADIAYALSAKGEIRIEAPVPGRSIVGIEVPNNKVAMVSIKDVLQSKEFSMSPSPLAFALGKDITGTVKVCNLQKMPHLLVAGTTGSGKSVCLNAIIVSILYKASPDDVKFIMIDPKQVELSMYEGLPHMVVPKVITDANKAVNALQWAVDEMERRFNLISDARVRNIDEYNKIDDVVSGKKRKMPYLVIIFDEFADFMMVAKNEIEDKIMRLAQKARAAGIHLILATQRPSTDVVTGTIKANFPARIAFKVAGRVDSEVIMGATGAEKLLGHGDMLYKPTDSSPSRIQGCFIDTPETKDIVQYIIDNNEETYDEEAYNAINCPGKASNGGEGDNGMDPLLPNALKICIDVGVASTTMVQRKLAIGYPRAARIIDQMEQRGYISSQEGSKQRTVYTSIEEFYEIFGDKYD